MKTERKSIPHLDLQRIGVSGGTESAGEVANPRTAEPTPAPPAVASFGFRKPACRLRAAASLTSLELLSPARRQIID